VYGLLLPDNLIDITITPIEQQTAISETTCLVLVGLAVAVTERYTT
jgi:hypothetical protein